MVDFKKPEPKKRKNEKAALRCGLVFTQHHGIDCEEMDQAVGEFVADYGPAIALQELGYWMASIVRGISDLPGVPFVLTYESKEQPGVPQIRVQVEVLSDMNYAECSV